MKKRYGLLLALVFCGLAGRAMASTFETLSPDFKLKELNKTINNPSVPEVMREFAKGFKKDLERSIALAPVDAAKPPAEITDIKWMLNAFVPGSMPTMYLGAGTAGTSVLGKTYALAQASILNGELSIVALADQAVVNGAAAVTSPFNAKQIGSMSLLTGFPVVVVVDAALGLNVYLVAAPAQGISAVFQNATPIKDATPAVITNQIVSVAASDSYIFAVVPANGSAFNAVGGIARGIAALRRDANQLTVLNATNLADATAPQAAKIDVTTAANLIAFGTTTGANIGSNNVYSTYDSTMGRMYICLTRVTGANAAAGGVLGIFTARVDTDATGKNSIKVEPFVVAPASTLFTDDVATGIIGFNSAANASNITVSTKFPRVMHTSTGRDYFIMQSTVAITAGATVNGVYALPLLPNDTSITDANKKGTLAAVTALTGLADFTKPPANAATMVTNTLPAINIPFTTVDWTYLTDIFVEGDSVFFCVNDTVATTSGVYRCTALFNADGSIINWTEPRRVTGDVRHVWGGAIDNSSGNIYCITAQDENTNTDINNTVRVTQWGKSDAIANDWDTDNPNNLSSVLDGIFPEKGSIHQMVSFDDQTPGFDLGKCAMTVALGFNNLAMIQTGAPDSLGAGFYPNEKFFTTGVDQNVFSFASSAVLGDIGPLCCCELSRIAAAGDNGWLMVGGYKGVAVLRKPGTGDGFTNPLATLAGGAVGYPGDGSTYTFKQLVVKNADGSTDTDFTYIKKIVASQGYFFIFTPKNIYMLEATVANFVNTKTLNVGTDIYKISMTNNAIISDAIGWSAAAPKFLLATTKGLYQATINLGTHGFATGPTLIPMKELDSAGKTIDITPAVPAVHLSYISKARGNPGTTGNLFVLCSRVKDDMAKVYRFYFDGINLTQINEYDATLFSSTAPINNGIVPGPFVTLLNFRGNIISDGAILYNLCAKHLDRTNYLDAIPQGFVGTEYDIWSTVMSSVDTNTYRMVGALIQEGAFGGWMLPSASGLWVNL